MSGADDVAETRETTASRAQVPGRGGRASILLGIPIVGALVFGGLSIYPGAIAGGRGCFWPLVLLAFTAVLACYWLREAAEGGIASARAAIGGCILGVSLAIAIWVGVPRRLAFEFRRAEFEACLSRARIDEPVSPGHWLGVYRGDQFARDWRGGVYFQVSRGQGDLWGMDTRFCGFAYRPNGKGTPFGSKGYRLLIQEVRP